MQEQITLIYGYLYGMWRYRWSALLIAWIVAVAGWLLVFALPDQYKSSAVIYIDADSMLEPLLDGLAIETERSNEFELVSRFLLSQENLLAVIREAGMDRNVHTAGEKEELAASLAESIELTARASQNQPRKRAVMNIFEISYQSTSAQQVYQVVSNLLDTAVDRMSNSGRSESAMAQEFLDEQIKDYEQRLTIAEQRLAKFKKANLGLMPDESGGYYVRLQRAQENAETTRSALRLAQRRQAELRKQLLGETPMLGNSSYGTARAMRLRQYQEQLNELLMQYTEQHPDVQALRSQIADLEASNVSGSGNVNDTGTGDSAEFNPVYHDLKLEISKAGVEIETLRIQLSEQEKHIEQLKQSVDEIPEVEAELAKLNRDYELTKERYLGLIDRRESARLAQEAEQSRSDLSIKIIQRPVVPGRPSGPDRLLLLTGVLFAAMAAGLGWSLLRYLLHPTFFNYRQLRSSIGLPVLGAVGLYLSPEHKKKRHLQLISFFSAAVLLVGVFGGALWYRDAGSALVGSVISVSGPDTL